MIKMKIMHIFYLIISFYNKKYVFCRTTHLSIAEPHVLRLFNIFTAGSQQNIQP